MPTVDLTARLARETKPGDRDVFLFDRALPARAGRKVSQNAGRFLTHPGSAEGV